MDVGNEIQQAEPIRIIYKNAGMGENDVMKFFTDHLLFSTISQFLTVKEVLALASVKHQLKLVVEHYCRSKLAELSLKPSTQKSSMHQMQFYFNRCLKITRRDDKNGWAPCLSIHHPFKFQSIHYFEVGTTFTSYATRDHKARIFRTATLLKYYQNGIEEKKGKNKIEPLIFQCIENVKDVRSKSDQCLVLKMNGEVIILSTNKNDQQVLTLSEPINWTNRIPVSAIYNSFAYSIFLPSIWSDPAILFNEVFNKKWPDEWGNKENKKSYLVGRNMANGKEFIIELPCAEVVEVAVGGRYSYFISDKNQLYEADFQDKIDPTIPVIKAYEFQPLKNKTIAKIVSGFNYYLALERKIEQIQEWDTEKVVEWLRHIGFESYVKIAKVEKLNGMKLKNIDKKYMNDALGITTQNMQHKLLMCVDQIINRKSNNDHLWGWGRNDNGQLGSSSANFVARPQKIRLNCMHQDEYIDSIYCGWFQTFVRTQKGRIYCTKIKKQKRRKGSEHEKEDREEQEYLVVVQKKEEREMMGSEEQIEEELQMMEKGNRRKSSRGQNQKKKKKTIDPSSLSIKQRQKQSNNKKFEQQESWEEFAEGKAFFIQAYKETIFIIQCPNQHKEQPNKVKKLRTAKAILDKILWSSLNKQQFKVGYTDKQVGLIELSALDLQKFEVKQNRIKYFKHNNVIVWDRENKIDMLS